MKRLESILAKYATPNLAGDQVKAAPPPDVPGLVGELRGLRRENEVYFMILVGMLVVVFVAALVLTFVFARHPEALAAVLGASGIGVGFAIRTMATLWKQKVLMGLIIVLIPNMKPTSQQKIIDLIFTFLQKGAADLMPAAGGGQDRARSGRVTCARGVSRAHKGQSFSVAATAASSRATRAVAPRLPVRVRTSAAVDRPYRSATVAASESRCGLGQPLERRPQPREHHQERLPLGRLQQVVDRGDQRVGAEQDRRPGHGQHAVEQVAGGDHQLRRRRRPALPLRPPAPRPAARGSRTAGPGTPRAGTAPAIRPPRAAAASANRSGRIARGRPAASMSATDTRRIDDRLLLLVRHGRRAGQREAGPVVAAGQQVLAARRAAGRGTTA